MVLLLVGVIVFTIRRLVTGPMANVRDFTSEIAHGNFKAELTGKYVCELKDLSENIDRMVGELKNKLGFSEGVLNGISIPCIVADADEKALFLNQDMLDLVGKSGNPEDYLGRTVGILCIAKPAGPQLPVRLWADNAARRNIEAELPVEGGGTSNVLVNASPLFDLDGQMLGAFIMITDMTEIKQQQKRIEENNIMISEAAANATEVSKQVSSFSKLWLLRSSNPAAEQRNKSVMASEAATAMDEIEFHSIRSLRGMASTAAELADVSQKKAGEGEQKVVQAVETIALVRAQSDQMQKDMADLGQQLTVSEILWV